MYEHQRIGPAINRPWPKQPVVTALDLSPPRPAIPGDQVAGTNTSLGVVRIRAARTSRVGFDLHLAQRKLRLDLQRK